MPNAHDEMIFASIRKSRLRTAILLELRKGPLPPLVLALRIGVTAQVVSALLYGELPGYAPDRSLIALGLCTVRRGSVGEVVWLTPRGEVAADDVRRRPELYRVPDVARRDLTSPDWVATESAIAEPPAPRSVRR